MFLPLLLSCLDNNLSSWSCLGFSWSCLGLGLGLVSTVLTLTLALALTLTLTLTVILPNPHPVTLSTQHHMRQNARNVHDTAEDDKRQHRTRRATATNEDEKTNKESKYKQTIHDTTRKDKKNTT
jgi:hypothetical protein